MYPIRHLKKLNDALEIRLFVTFNDTTRVNYQRGKINKK